MAKPESNDTLLRLADWIGAHALGAYGIGLAVVLIGVVMVILVAGRFSGYSWRLRMADDGGRPGSEEGAATAVRTLLQLALAIAIALAGAALFAAMMEALDADDSLGRFDTRLAEALAAGTSERLLRIFGLATHLGDPLTLTAIVVVVAVLLIGKRRPWLALAWVLTTAGSGLFNRALKAIFERVRPLHDHGYAVADGFSFPSGHSSGSLVVYGFLTYLAIRLFPVRVWLPVACVAAALTWSMGASRVILSVHWASDVLAGFGSGLAWLIVCVTVVEAWRQRRRRAAGVAARPPTGP